MSTVRLIYFAVFLLPLAIHPLAFHPFETAKITWLLMVIGGAFLFLGRYFFQSKSTSVYLHHGLIIYSLSLISILLISTLFSDAPALSFWGDYLRFNGSLFFLLFVIHFWILIQILDNKNMSLLLNIIKWTGGIMSVYALLQYFDIDPLFRINNAEYLFRIYSTIGQPNLLAQWLIFPLFISLNEALTGKKDRRMHWLMVTLMLIVIYLTKNRATWLALGMTGMISLLSFGWIQQKTKIIIITLLGFIGAFGFYFADLNLRSVLSRFILWESSLKLVTLKSLLVGEGLNSFPEKILTVLPKNIFEYENFYTLPASPHNESIQLLIELGLPGLILYWIPIVFITYRVLKGQLKTGRSLMAAAALLTYFISVQFSFSGIEHWVIIAAFWAILLKEKGAFDMKTIKISRLTSTASIAVGIIMVLLGFSFTFSDLSLQRAIDAFVEGENSAPLFERATQWSPFYQKPALIALNILGDEKEKRMHLNKLQRLHPGGFQYKIQKMKEAGQSGDSQTIDFYFDRLQKRAPAIPVVYTEAGDAFYHANNCRQAINAYQFLKSLAPSAYYLKNSPRYEHQEKYRLFIKHASLFKEAMDKLAECKKTMN